MGVAVLAHLLRPLPAPTLSANGSQTPPNKAITQDTWPQRPLAEPVPITSPEPASASQNLTQTVQMPHVLLPKACQCPAAPGVCQ